MRKAQTILIIEDTHELRVSLRQFLESEGYKVESAAHGKAALDLLAAGARPSVILTDLMLPILDGKTLIAEIRKHPHFRKIPVIAMSTPSNQTDAIGADVFLPKPISLETLLAAIETLIGGLA